MHMSLMTCAGHALGLLRHSLGDSSTSRHLRRSAACEHSGARVPRGAPRRVSSADLELAQRAKLAPTPPLGAPRRALWTVRVDSSPRLAASRKALHLDQLVEARILCFEGVCLAAVILAIAHGWWRSISPSLPTFHRVLSDTTRPIPC